jgi:ATP-dependent DNA helicase RecG
MTIETIKITTEQADKIRMIDENQFTDIKQKEIKPKDLTTHLSAFANTDGGDLYIGITDKLREWDGFENVEAANGYLQCFEEFFPLGTNFKYEFLQCDFYNGLVLHAQIDKTQGICKASNKTVYIRRGAQSLPLNTSESIRRLELSKGVVSFENEITNSSSDIIIESEITKNFIKEVVPTTTPEAWLKKQNLIKDTRPTVGGVLLFSEEPQAILQKHCGIKIYRYKTREIEGFRDALAEQPITVEGCLYHQINESVKITKEIAESISLIGTGVIEKTNYPHETLHEILTNAVLHRDYSIKDDIHIRIFDNRIEVQSPGRLPAHITTKNILDERFARNGTIVRIINKFPNPPNKDVGEGLNTAFAKMRDLGLKNPTFIEAENYFLVVINHEPLASAVDTIMDYLEKVPSIKNAKAREITNIKTDFRMKSIFREMEKAGKIERVPGTNTSSTAWKRKTI